MNLSKGPEHPLETNRSHLSRIVANPLMLIVTGLLIVAAGWQFLRIASGPDPERPLAEARQLFAAIAGEAVLRRTTSEPVTTSNTLPQAAGLLESYLSGSAREPDAARLLLAATRTAFDPIRAERLLDDVRLSVCPAADLAHAALLFFIAQRNDAANRLIDAALAKPDSREQTVQAAALMRYELGLTEDALKFCREWSQLAPRDPGPWRLMSLVFDDRGTTELAATAYRNVVERAADDFGARRTLVDRLIQLGNVAAAREEFDRIPESKQPHEPRLQLTAARLFHLEGRPEAALSQLDTLLLKDPDNSAALLLKGKILLSGSNLSPAIEAFKRSLHKDPSTLDGHYLLGQAYARQGDDKNALTQLTLHEKFRQTKVLINSLEMEAARKPHDRAVRQKLVELYKSLGLFPQAQFWSNAAASMNPGQ